MVLDKSEPPGLDPKHTFHGIDKPTLQWILERYSSLFVDGDEGEHLDELRYKTIPHAVKAREANPHLDKEELVTLVTWKLKHGTFRPALKSLVQQNHAQDVEKTSRKGFAEFDSDKPKDAIKTLSSLKGVGPATASLMLSVYAPDKAPFFSDELFRWAFYEDGKGNGWDRKIKYTAKEYDQLYERVQEMLERLEVSAVEAEQVAYVLGKDGSIGESQTEEMGRPSKRKRDETVEEEKKRRGLHDDLPENDEVVNPAKETERVEASREGSKGRPKRKSRKV